MSKRYYNDYKYEKQEREDKEESKIFSNPDKKENNIVINGPVTINNETVTETNNEVNVVVNTVVQNKTVKVYCNVRKAPGGEIKTTYAAGQEVKVVGEKDGWSELDNGLFIRSDLLK